MILNRRSVQLIATPLVAAAFAATAPADVVLTVDASNPSAVVFTAEPGLSSTNIDAVGGGLLLTQFAEDSTLGGDLVPSSDPLRIAASGVGLDLVGPGVNNFAGGSGYGIIVFNALDNLVFNVGEVAFVGESTVDLSFLDLRSEPLVGDIEVYGPFGDLVPESFIGEFNYIPPIPEPAGLVAATVPALMLRRRR